MTNEFLLEDRLEKIRTVISKYGEENFYISFSGGKDSTIMSHMIDMAIPGNKIPRVYSNTGIEFNSKLQEALDMLEEYLPAERKQCEIIWQPVYEEYRRLEYRLRKDDE